MNPPTTTTRVSTRTLLLLSLALLALLGGVFNLRDRLHQKLLLTDGVVWKDDAKQGVVVGEIEPGSPAARAGIYRGDVLLGISTTGQEPFEEVTRAEHVQIYLDQLKDQARRGGSQAISYWVGHRNDAGDTILKEGIADVELQAQPTHQARDIYLFIVGLAYLGIGVYFLLRQARAPYVIHFFLLCLLAFIAHGYSATAEMRTQFDKAVDLADVIALILLAPAFVHFSAIYPLRDHLFKRRRALALLLYIPAALLILAELFLRTASLRTRLPISGVGLRGALSNIELVLYAASLVVSCALLVRTFRQSHSLTVRQQLKWVMSGMSLATFAFAAFYLPTFLASSASLSSLFQLVSLAPLILIPLTFGYSIVRYRLVDVDVVVRRSLAYITATLSVALLFGLVTAVSYEFLRSFLSQNQESAQSQRATLLVATVAMSLLAVLFAPVKNWVQERIDRLFYGEKYDYRVTLQDFGRTLSSTTELDPLLDSLMRRLKEVFPIDALAIFVEDRTDVSGFRVARAEGITRTINLPSDFLQTLRERSTANGIVRAEAEDETQDFAEGTGALNIGQRRRQQFSYYVPCAVRARVAAVIALGRPTDGAPLSSEDTNLLRAISGYVAVAIENALLLEEQAQRAQELARLKEFNENIIESINVGVMVVNLAGRVTNWNSALEEIYGLGREQAIGQRITEVFGAEMLRALRELMTRNEWQVGAGRAGEPVNIYKFRARSVDGRDLTLNISLAALQSKTAEIEGTLVAIEDVTERIRLEEQLQQSDKLSSIGLLAAGVAHEVNTPLTGISSYSQMLMQQIPETDPRHLLLEKIYRQTSRASSIVNNLLNFSRVSDARFAPINFNRVLDDTIQLLEAQLRNTQIEVVRDYDLELPLAPGNAAKLQQVFMNLILNARDAMPDGGRLEITTRCDGTSVLLGFRDTGMGIAPENLAKIYDPFFTTKQIGKGTGLGLAVSYGIIRDHGGHIHVESHTGQGTTFQLTLPLATARQQLAVASD